MHHYFNDGGSPMKRHSAISVLFLLILTLGLMISGCGGGSSSGGGSSNGDGGGGGLTPTSPTINGVQPQNPTVGSQLTISGTGFGAARSMKDNGQSYVSFTATGGGSVNATIYNGWVDTQILVGVPQLTPGQNYAVIVNIVTASGTSSSGSTQTAANTITPQAANPGGTLSGRVYNLFTGQAVASAVVSVSNISTETDASGNYSTTRRQERVTESRMTVTQAAIVTRSFPVDIDLSAQDASIISSSYNTTMLRAYCFGTGQSSIRWEPKPQRIVLYNQLYGSNPPQSADQTYLDATLNMIQTEFYTLADGYFNNVTFENFNGRPEDDTRLSQPQAGNFYGNGIIAVYFSTTFTGSTVGNGGWQGYVPVISAGFAHVKYGRSIPDTLHTVRHEMGHATGLAHPFDAIGNTSPYLEPSVMNYSIQYSADYSQADLDAYKYYYHRAPGNTAPDNDPDGSLGYKSGKFVRAVFID
jgi:hypothetical protein